MKTSIQTLLTAFVVVVILASSATTFTSCAKKDDPTPTSTTTSTITGITTTTSVAVTTGSGVVLGDQNNSNGSFFGATIGSPYTSGSGAFVTNISKIDFAYALQPNNSSTATAKIISPSTITVSTGFNSTISTISGKNLTYFAAAPSGTVYSSLTGTSLSSLATSTSWTATDITVATSGVYLYKTAAGKTGAINVTNVNSNSNSNNTSTSNTLTFDFIVVQ